ncbi:MAG: CPBP family intramembrane metalloprotease [Anaerolineales bacterium]|jgi:membrane protease YdiL (CAAX protease family)|nr:CPBP family intramembrane metalloprotease [Anaerolineales bacterium]
MTKPHSLTVFFALSFLISWMVWVPASLASHNLISFKIDPTLSGSLGAIGPSLAALITIAIYDGGTGFRDLFGRLLTWRVGLRWYLFVFLWAPCLSLTVTAVSVLVGGSIPNFAQPPFANIFSSLLPTLGNISPFIFLPFFFLQQLLLGSSMGEEPGWRGYALPRMQFKSGAWQASILLGMLWGLWHLPLWLTKGNFAQETFIGWHYLELIATSVLFGWVYNNTKGSLFLALLFHTSIGVTGLFLASVEFYPWLPAAFSWGTALLVTTFSKRVDRAMAIKSIYPLW